jgi:hypothetical protein
MNPYLHVFKASRLNLFTEEQENKIRKSGSLKQVVEK